MLDITTRKPGPFFKPNANTTYVATMSNHPPMVLKNIPRAVNQRLRESSSSKEIFEGKKNTY